MQYDRAYMRNFYDAYGEKEWRRLDASFSARLNFVLHQHYLLQHIKPSDQVLEAGAGAGRFTLELAALGARITVLALSPEQLRLNKQHVEAEGQTQAVQEWVEGDITDLSRFPACAFDAVVCYGGPLSYVANQAETALAQMRRVLRPGGHLLLSVMSLLGTTRHFLAGVVEAAYQQGVEKVDNVTRTGDLTPDVSRGHQCHMYRWSELRRLLEGQGFHIETASAAGFLSMAPEETLRTIHARRDLWDVFVNWELAFASEPGAIDGGTHIIAVVTKPLQ